MVVTDEPAGYRVFSVDAAQNVDTWIHWMGTPPWCSETVSFRVNG